PTSMTSVGFKGQFEPALTSVGYVFRLAFVSSNGPNANQHGPVLAYFQGQFSRYSPHLTMLSSVATDARKAKTASGNGRQFGQDGHGWKRSKEPININTLANADEM